MIDFSLEGVHQLTLLAGVYIVLLWIAITLWIARDAIGRSHSIFFHFLAVFSNVILPF